VIIPEISHKYKSFAAISRAKDDTLSAAYTAADRFDEAVETAEKALELARSASQQQLVNEIQEHLELYKIGQPYRERTRTQNESEEQGS